MDASQFAQWLQGFAELTTTPPTPEQWQSIREHLQLVFTKVTPKIETKITINPDPEHKTLQQIAEEITRLTKRRQSAQWPQNYPKGGDIIC